MNCRPQGMLQYKDVIIANINPQVTDYRTGGSVAMMTWNKTTDMPAFVYNNPAWKKKQYVPTDAEIANFCLIASLTDAGIIFVHNVNDLPANTMALRRRYIQAGGVITGDEIGNELYLNKFLKAGAGSKDTPGFISQITAAQFKLKYVDFVTAIKSEDPNAVIVAPIAPDNTSGKIAWNNNVGNWYSTLSDALKPNALAIHVYETGDSGNDDEFGLPLSSLDKWPFPLWFTEAGTYSADWTPEGIEKWINFHKGIISYCISRGDNSKGGTHTFFQPNSNETNISTLHVIPDGLTPIGVAAKAWPFGLDQTETIEEEEIKEEEVVDTAGLVLPIVTKRTSAIKWTQELTFSDGSVYIHKSKADMSAPFFTADQEGCTKSMLGLV